MLPVPIASIFGSKIISESEKFSSFNNLYERLQISIFLSKDIPCPFSSKAITTTAVPYFFIILAFFLKDSSPSFREIEFTIDFPAIFFKAVSIVRKSDESIIIGIFETIGSFWIILKNFSISSWGINNPSSRLMSKTAAPFSICKRAISKAFI